MAGSSGVLRTGHWLVRPSTGDELGEVASTTVVHASPSEQEIDAYIATGEPLRVAGGFTLDGLGGPFVERIEGDPSNVIGLSLPLLRVLLGRLGITWTDLWSSP
jgi:septum formation protein